MSYYVGLDVGAVSITAAVLSQDGDAPMFAQDTAWQRLGPGSSQGTAGTAANDAAVAPMSGRLYLSPYRRARGRPIEAARELLEEIVSAVAAAAGSPALGGLCLTGSAAALVAQKLGADVINEFKAVALGLSVMGVRARTVFEMGGQSSKYLLLDCVAGVSPAGLAAGTAATLSYSIADYSTNGDCAAGTGSFIDQQAGRLRLAVEDIGHLALEAQRTAQVAGRCSVFAKSDMIHAQQKGYKPEEVLAGLCNAVARNFRMAVVRSHHVEKPVVFIGGLAANAAVVRGLREAFELGEGELTVPEGFAHVPAAGAAHAAAMGQSAPAGSKARRWDQSAGLAALREASDSTRGKFATAEPLRMDRVVLLRDQVDPYELPLGRKVDAFMGIDIGSVSTNVALIDPDGNVIKEIYVRTQGRPVEVVSQCLSDVAAELGERVVIRGVGTTGSGRELIGELVGADTVNDEITAHKTGAVFIGRKMLDGRLPDTIFEIGGQDSKYISLQDEIVVDFTMNEACAAGTGSFLEERAEELDISIIDEFARLALSSRAPIRLGERCTVFMERDVNDYLQRGADKQDLVAGLAYSVAYNYINRVVRGRAIGNTIFFQGGTAYNDSVAAAFSAVLGKEIIVPPYNGVMGAIGSALLAREKMLSGQSSGAARTPEDLAGRYVSEAEGGEERSTGILVAAATVPPVSGHSTTVPAVDGNGSMGETPMRHTGETPVLREAHHRPLPRSRFRGYDLGKVHYNLREFTCKGCSNRCVIQEFDVEGEKTYWGDKCSDRYRKQSKSTIKPVIDDLFALRQRLMDDEQHLPEPRAGAPTIGIPRCMFAMDRLPFWRTFWRHCGMKVVASDPTNRDMVTAGTQHAVAEPCFPVIVAHGHVAALLEAGVEYVFLPNTVSAETQWADNESYLCPWNQTLPFVLRRVPAFERHMGRFLMPSIRFREGFGAVARELIALCQPLGVARATVRAALRQADQAHQAFKQRLLDAGRQALAILRQTGQPGIVIIGRPYNVHDATVSLSIARKLRDFYGVNCIPIDCLDTDPVDIRDIDWNMYWDYGRKLLAAARIVEGEPNLHIIQITNFKCGPDSFVKHFIRPASGKPFLALQVDGHSNDAGMLTRCEAYLDSKGILRPWKKQANGDQRTANSQQQTQPNAVGAD